METDNLIKVIRDIKTTEFEMIEKKTKELHEFSLSLNQTEIALNGKSWLYKLRENIADIYSSNKDDSSAEKNMHMIELFVLGSYYLVKKGLFKMIIADSSLNSHSGGLL